MPSTYKYLYPNYNSYQMIPPRPRVGLYNGQLLRHGYIFGYKQTTANTPGVNPSTGASTNSGTGNVHPIPSRELDYSNVMVFQFNPANLPLNISFMLTDSAEEQIPGGALPAYSPGLATSDQFELWFDRTNEVARATMGNPGRAGESKWRELGVQCDVFDLLKVISGGKTSAFGEYEDPGYTTDEEEPASGRVLPGSTNHLTGLLFDAIAGGAQAYFNSFAVVFNQNLALHVNRCTGFSFSYVKFTADLVPIQVRVQMNLEIMNMGTKAFVTSGGAAGPPSSTAPSDTTTAPPGTTTQSTAPRTGAY